MDANYGASIFIMAGRYNCKTEITASAATGAAERHGIALRGEGKSTLLYWAPSSTITNGIKLKMNHAQLHDMMLWANDKVVNLVRGEGPSIPGQYNWGHIENVSFYGQNTNIPIGGANKLLPGTNIITGQTGLYVFTDGDEGGSTSYFSSNWKIHNCEFAALDFGAKFEGGFTDMSNHSNVHIGACRTGYWIGGTQHNLNNFRIESSGTSTTPPEVGSYGIYLKKIPTGGANITMLSNINGELRGTGAQLVHVESGINNCHMRNVYNSGANDIDKFNVFDENITGLNLIYDSKYNPVSPDMTVRRVGYITGMNQGVPVFDTTVLPTLTYLYTATSGFGECAVPNVRENTSGTGAAVTTSFDGNDQFTKKLSTGSTSGNHASLQFVQAYHSRPSNMRIQGRIRTPHGASIRIFIGLINLGNPTAPALMTAPPAGSIPDILDPTYSTGNGVGLWLNTDATTQWRVIHNDATTGASVKDTIVGDPVIDTSTAYHKFEIISEDAANRFGVRYDNAMNIVTSRIPATGTRLGWLIFVQNAGVAATRDIFLQHVNMAVNR